MTNNLATALQNSELLFDEGDIDEAIAPDRGGHPR